MLLAARDSETGAGLSDRELRDEVTTIFVAGHETTANALAWAWYLISTHPEVRARMEQEFDTVLGGALPEPHHYPELRYTQAVMKESLRLYPAVWILGRKALEQVPLGPMQVRKGAVVLVCMFTLHRRPELYGDALTFRPERWLEGSPAPHRMAYLPFGAGSRLCIGERLAWTESVLILATLAQRFHLTPERSEPPTPMTLLTLRPKQGVKARITPRSRPV
jgi:cytochrome P450